MKSGLFLPELIEDHCSVYRGDCLEVMPTLPAKSVNLILADLPYGATSCAWDSQIPLGPLWQEYRRALGAWSRSGEGLIHALAWKYFGRRASTRMAGIYEDALGNFVSLNAGGERSGTR